MKLSNYNFELPESLIAQTPLERRDSSRLLVLGTDDVIEHRHFSDLKDYLRPGDLLILNNSKVMPVWLTGRKPTGGRLEILIVKRIKHNKFYILSRGRYSGKVYFDRGVEAEINEGNSAEFNMPDMNNFIWEYGEMPLPPYIKRRPDQRDREWYQTVYAENEGSIAAPTAGLHFTEELLKEISSKGVTIKKLTLHVGIGTFKPIKGDFINKHKMEPEEFEVEAGLLNFITETKKIGGKVFAVGTTTTRVIESFMSGQYKERGLNGYLRGTTNIFIYPGYHFKAIDCLITNFHLPGSTPLLLVSALAGRDRVLNAYKIAIDVGYRFFSYGDAMLIL